MTTEVAAQKLINVFFTQEGELTPEAIALIPEGSVDEGKEKAYILGFLSSFNIPEEFVIEHIESFNKPALALDGHITTQVIEADIEGFSNAIAAAYSNRESSINAYLIEAVFEDDMIHPYTKAEVARGALECLYSAIENYAKKTNDDEKMEDFIQALLSAYEELFMECGGYIVTGIENNIFEEADLLTSMMDWTWVLMVATAQIKVPLEVQMRLTEEVGAYAIRSMDSFVLMEKGTAFVKDCIQRQVEAQQQVASTETDGE